MDYELCNSNFNELVSYYNFNKGTRNEATTRLHLINTLFLECLGWEKNDVICEDHYNGEYTDYTFGKPKKLMIVEAKKEGIYFEVPAGETKIYYKIKSVMDFSPETKSAIKQVSEYCQSRGVPNAVVTNGFQLIAFIATRQDGIPPFDGKAFVISSYEQLMNGGFLTLWNSLSSNAISKGLLKSQLLSGGLDPLPPKLSVSTTNYPGFKERNAFQTDLKILSDLIFEDLTKHKEIEIDFLKECYCQSGALSKYALMSKALLKSRYSILFDKSGSAPTIKSATTKSGISPEILAESMSSRPILLIGDVGVGKTTFIRNLINIGGEEVFENAITLYLNLGSEAVFTVNIKEYILQLVEQQLRENYSIDIFDNKFVRRVYKSDIQRFSKGIYSSIKNSAPDKYEDKLIESLQDKIKNLPSHVMLSLDHITRGFRKQIIIFLDNSDQRSDQTQQDVFLVSQEIAEKWPATVFIAIRPETFHKSRHSGALSGYHPKAFTILPPRIDLVLKKRLAFGIKLAEGKFPISLLPKDTEVKFKNISSIFKSFSESLDFSNAINKAIENISGGNVRSALEFVKEFFGSGHVNTEKIVNLFEKEGRYYVPLHEFLRAILYADHTYYFPPSSPIVNIYDISHRDESEYFLMSIMLGTLASSSRTLKNSGFMQLNFLYETLQNLGYIPLQIERCLLRAFDKKLLITSGRLDPNVEFELIDSIRITTVGLYHFQILPYLFTYYDSMLVDIPIIDRKIRRKIALSNDIPHRICAVEEFQKYLDCKWASANLKTDVYDWMDISNKLSEDIKFVQKKYLKYLEKIESS